MAQPRGQLSLTHTKEGDASRLPLLCGLQQPQHQTVYRAGGGAEHDDRPGHGEHLHGGAGDKSLCLCQDRDEENFCPILLGFWLLKFLKKSAFFAKLL